MDSKGYCKLSNFKDCDEYPEKIDDESPISSSRCYKLEYRAPEFYGPDDFRVEPTADYWRIGILIFKMITGNFPFFGYRSILNDEIPQLNQLIFSNEAKEIISDLLIKDKTERLGSKNSKKQIRKMKFFNDIDWLKLERRELISPFNPKFNIEQSYFEAKKDEFDDQFEYISEHILLNINLLDIIGVGGFSKVSYF